MLHGARLLANPENFALPAKRASSNPPRGILQIEKPGLPGKHSRKVFHRKTIVPGRHWSVGREDAFTADLFDVLATDGFPSRLGSFFVEQLQRKQRGVAFVHVVAREVVVAQRVENAHASDS